MKNKPWFWSVVYKQARRSLHPGKVQPPHNLYKRLIMGYYYSLKHTNPKSLHHIFHYSIIYITFAHIKATKNSCWLIRLSLYIFLDTSIYLSNNNNISLFEILINILVRLVKVCIYTFLNYSIRFDKSLCKRFLVRPACEGRADFCLYNYHT